MKTAVHIHTSRTGALAGTGLGMPVGTRVWAGADAAFKTDAMTLAERWKD